MRCWMLAAFALAVAFPAHAGEISFDPDFTTADLDRLADAAADAIAFPVLGSAAARGLVGFDLLGVIGGPRVDADSGWWRRGTAGARTTVGALAAPRLVAHKGLPWRLEVGGQVGSLLGESFWGADLKWTWLEGGLISPALAVRISYTRMSGAPLDLSIGEVQALLSKGFAVLTPYAAVGYREAAADARFGVPIAEEHEANRGRPTATVGVSASLLPFLLVGELRWGAGTAVFLGVGVGL